MSRFTRDAISKPAFLLVVGRTIGFAASFIIPVLLVRTFNQAEFGTYKQLFLIYGTLYGLAQFGMAESLYYFVPRKPQEAGPYIANTIMTLALAGIGCLGLLWIAEDRIVAWLSNPQLADHIVLLGAFLMLMLISAAFEIVMVARKQHLTAAWTYGASDVVRTMLLVIPAFVQGGLRGGPVGRRRIRRGPRGGDAALAAPRVRRRPAAEPRALEVSARLRAAVCARGRHRSAPGEPAFVCRRVEVRCGDVCDLRGRLPADSAGRSHHDVDGERDDGEDGRGRAARAAGHRARAVAPHDGRGSRC